MGDRPLIGLTMSFKDGSASVKVNYAECVIEAGGVPVALPVVDDAETVAEAVGRLEGLVLVGGRDIDPSEFGEALHPATKLISGERYRFERRLIERWLAAGKPVLAICLGIQFVNVIAGGSVVQHIPDEYGEAVSHRKSSPAVARHGIDIVPGTKLHDMFGQERIEVNSYHHQSVGNLGEGLVVSARSDDGVIEALEFSDDRFGVFVQWHPERMADAGHRLALFGGLVNACSGVRG